MLRLYVLAAFLGAFLLFMVQPMMARLVLPALGGSPAVWNTCMLFFQALLLGGYVYAHLITRKLPPRRQAAVHLLVVIVALVALPPDVQSAGQPDGSPVGWLLFALALGVGAPFFVLSSAAPLFQSWFSQTEHARSRDPYFLYAASNAGSLLALLCYPVLFEPIFGLGQQNTLWSAAFIGFAALMLMCAWRLPASPGRTEEKEAGALQPLPWRTKLRWVAFEPIPDRWSIRETRYS